MVAQKFIEFDLHKVMDHKEQVNEKININNL